MVGCYNLIYVNLYCRNSSDYLLIYFHLPIRGIKLRDGTNHDHVLGTGKGHHHSPGKGLHREREDLDRETRGKRDARGQGIEANVLILEKRNIETGQGQRTGVGHHPETPNTDIDNYSMGDRSCHGKMARRSFIVYTYMIHIFLICIKFNNLYKTIGTYLTKKIFIAHFKFLYRQP